MKLPKRGSLVRVEWDDASSNDAWSAVQPTLTRCTTYGILVRSGKRRVSIAASIAQGSARAYAERITIPLGSVRRVKRLKGRR